MIESDAECRDLDHAFVSDAGPRRPLVQSTPEDQLAADRRQAAIVGWDLAKLVSMRAAHGRVLRVGTRDEVAIRTIDAFYTRAAAARWVLDIDAELMVRLAGKSDERIEEHYADAMRRLETAPTFDRAAKVLATACVAESTRRTAGDACAAGCPACRDEDGTRA